MIPTRVLGHLESNVQQVVIVNKLIPDKKYLFILLM
jgi:hypothetical protein